MKIIKQGVDPGDPNVQQKSCSNCGTVVEVNVATEGTTRETTYDNYQDFDPDGRGPETYCWSETTHYREIDCPTCKYRITLSKKTGGMFKRPDAPPTR